MPCCLPSVNKIFQDATLSHTEKSFKSVLMQNILSKVLRLSKLDTPVILIGEVGTGKKRLAQIIHQNSFRASHPFYPFCCLDLTVEEYENAFREQLHLNDGRFVLKYDVIEKASKGILYLDQFSELPNELMLNVIQSFENGSEQLFRYSQAAEPRLMISMNMDSYATFADSPKWHNILNMLDPQLIMVPPLRERKEDIPLLVNSFIKCLKNKSEKYHELSISDGALQTCSTHSWPGNIRQLNNALLQGAVLSHWKTIENHHLPFSMNWELPYKAEANKY